jgi:mono/diheme cytochrome c family protein
VAREHAGRADVAAYLAGKIKSGGSGLWGGMPMPAQTLGDADAKAIAKWLAEGAKKWGVRMTTQMGYGVIRMPGFTLTITMYR